jgi:hypothetical protein
MKRTTITFICTLDALVRLLAPDDARACSREPDRGVDFDVLPAADAMAPSNTLVWVALDDGVIPSEISLRQRDALVTTTAREIVVAGEVETVLLVLAPSEPLASGEPVLIMRGTEQLSRFFVTAEPLAPPPAQPRVTAIDVVAEYDGCYSCPAPSSVAIGTDRTDSLVLILPSAEGLPFEPVNSRDTRRAAGAPGCRARRAAP